MADLYTPGPWRWTERSAHDDGDQPRGSRLLLGPTGNEVVEALSNNGSYDIAGGGLDVYNADARLIEQAPALLHLLKLCTGDAVPNWPAIALARRLIADIEFGTPREMSNV